MQSHPEDLQTTHTTQHPPGILAPMPSTSTSGLFRISQLDDSASSASSALPRLPGPGETGYIFRTEKVFIGNLPPTATRTVLRRHFSQYGKITDCVIMVNKDGSGRGFGFCEFEDPESVDRVIDAWENHYINGQWVEVKRASPENAVRKYTRSRGSLKVSSHFVHPPPPAVLDETFPIPGEACHTANSAQLCG